MAKIDYLHFDNCSHNCMVKYARGGAMFFFQHVERILSYAIVGTVQISMSCLLHTNTYTFGEETKRNDQLCHISVFRFTITAGEKQFQMECNGLFCDLSVGINPFSITFHFQT